MKNFILITLILSICLKINAESNLEDIINSSRTIDLTYSGSFSSDCHKLNKIKLETNGIITLEIIRLKPSYTSKVFTCSVSKIYDVEVYPSDKGAYIVGAKGVRGKITDDRFYIQVSPKTEAIRIKYFSDKNTKGEVKIKRFDVGYIINKIKNRIADLRESESTIPSWQKAFKETETKLISEAKNDKQPPNILITSPVVQPEESFIEVDNYTTLVRGKVKDNKGVMKLLVGGNNTSADENGNFVAKVKLGFGENKIKVQAEDVNGNISEKTLIIIRKEFLNNNIFSDVDIPIKTSMKNKNTFAVVIGIENYQYVPDAKYAYNDAQVFREYLIETLGISKQNIKMILNSKATYAEINKLLGSKGWLKRNVKDSTSNIIIYFAGHGISNLEEKTTGLLAFDIDPNYSIGIDTKNLYKNLANLNANSITIFLDACFTGQTREEKLLIADSRPITIVPKINHISDNMSIFTATSNTQTSGAIKEQEHGLFTYFLLKGLRGNADDNKDKKLTLFELNSFITKEVSNYALNAEREQTPQLLGSKDKILIKYD
ncbi:MAG: hypothetical protein CFH34_00899 [Alphaproteobacteria bacterium MarineAlpha9_Bin4]|nr:MAG: hypothetical protein CFH34_00899 [Alphaproteobacteria bacterium MarineAlpha9_Bin4]